MGFILDREVLWILLHFIVIVTFLALQLGPLILLLRVLCLFLGGGSFARAISGAHIKAKCESALHRER